ncbi:MAG: aminotransferase class I/II-fold pyridoxal phosphate-dependent enzyme [Desulfacinum sp.]|nr:aminotransferase class I/II-fold pyridoxal phosphate-dependent enzyme [Desulfacinum sp.]
MTLKVSRRLEWVAQSEIRNMSIECERLGGINLSQGVCDLEIPDPVRRGAQRAIDEGYNVYTRYDGLQELREAIAHKHKQFSGLEVDPEGEVIVSAGATGAFYCACLALLEPGDEVIVFEPFYGYHISTLVATQARPVFVRLRPPGWTFTEEDLEAAVTPRTRGILVNTPANPSGKVFSREELETVGRFATRHDFFIFTDEIYEYFVYDGRRHVPPAAVEGIRERTITISGLSKTFSITGWRIGYCICDRKWARPIGWFNDLVYVCAPAPLQIGVARGLLQLDAGYYEHIAREYEGKRDRICDALTRAGLDPVVPQGAYYVLADISRLPGDTSKDKAMFLLQKTGVAAVPGEAFYHDEAGSQLARFCFAKRDDVLDEACRRIAQLPSL